MPWRIAFSTRCWSAKLGTAADCTDGSIATKKVSSTPESFGRAIVEGVSELVNWLLGPNGGWDQGAVDAVSLARAQEPVARKDLEFTRQVLRYAVDCRDGSSVLVRQLWYLDAKQVVALSRQATPAPV